MTIKDKYTGFGFDKCESVHHFVVTIPASNREDVIITEYFVFDAEEGYQMPSLGMGTLEHKIKVILSRDKWNAIAEDVRVEFNRRLKKQGIPSGRWKTGHVPVSRLLGKELVLLGWAIEDSDPALIPFAIKNWLGLASEERWWLFTMTNAATGHAIHGKGKGWRKAVRFALTENPVTGERSEPPSELFNLVATEVEKEELIESKKKTKKKVPKKVIKKATV